MKSGALVPDAMILRLILNELKTRGWLFSPGGPETLTLSSATAAATADDFDMDPYVGSPVLEHLSTPPLTSDDPSASFILDGFPRTKSQATQLDTLVPINFVVSLKTPFSAILDRIANRWVHAP